MRAILLAGLVSSALQVDGHPAISARHELSRRTVDLNAFRLVSTAEYTNSTETAVNATISSNLLRRDSYVDTATELVKATFPALSFRIVDDFYIGSNGVGHVNFKQTAHDLDIDNADFNVNVSLSSTLASTSRLISHRLGKMGRFSLSETPSLVDTFLLSARSRSEIMLILPRL